MFMVSRSKFIAMAHAILRNREDAEDAVQNAFISAHLHLRSFEGRSALRTWLTRIVLNAALMIQRKRKPIPVRPPTDTELSHDADWLERIPAPQADPEMIHGKRETLELINGILRKMKPILRQAFTMTYFDEMSNREASGLIGVPEGTFKARLFRARRYVATHAPHSLLAPPRRRAAWGFSSSGKDDYQALATRPTEMSSLEAALS
jgi:RNA polymerase sigma-70 factor, ECF subfamily